MKANQANLLLSLVSLLLFTCKSEHNIEVYNLSLSLNPKIKLATNTNDKIKLNFCNEIPFEWDRIVIVPSYTTVRMFKRHKFTNSAVFEKQLPVLASEENRVLMLFIDKNTILRYSLISISPLDFNIINNKSTHHRTIDRLEFCDRLYIKKVNENLRLFFD